MVERFEVAEMLGELVDLQDGLDAGRQWLGHRAGARHGGDQLLRVGMVRAPVNATGRARFDDFAGVHDHDAISDLRDHAEVVGDQEEAHAGFRLQLFQQGQDLRLDGDVEGGGRLVGDQNVGLEGQRHGDHQTLTLTSRELVRVFFEAGRRLGDADARKQLQRRIGRKSPLDAVRREGFGELEAGGVDGVEVAEWVLEDHGDLLAVDLPSFVFRTASGDRDRHSRPRRRLSRRGDNRSGS